MKTLLKLALLLGLTQLVAHAQVTVNGATIIAGGSPTQAVTSVNGNPGALVLTGSGVSCVFASGTTTCTFSGGGGSGGFPFILGSTSIGANSTVTSVSGLTVNGVALTAGGSASQFLNGQGNYVAPTGSGTVQTGPQYALTGYPTSGSTNTVGPAPNLWELAPGMTAAQVNTLIASLTPGHDVVIIPPGFPQMAFTNNSYVEMVDLRPAAMTITVGGAGVACDASTSNVISITSGSPLTTVGAFPGMAVGNTITFALRSGLLYGSTQQTWSPTILSVVGGVATLSSNAPFSYSGYVVNGKDNTAALQQILNNASAAWPLYIPTGCRILTGPLAWNKGQSFIGQQSSQGGFVSKVAMDILQNPDTSGAGNAGAVGVRVENLGFVIDSPLDPTVGSITDYDASASPTTRAPLYRPLDMAPESQNANNPCGPGWITNGSQSCNGVASITQNSAVICVPNALGRLPAVGQTIVFPYQTAVFTSTIASTAGSCSAGFTARTMAGAFPNTSGYTVAQAEYFAGSAVQQITSTIAANPTLPLTVNLSLPTQPVPGFESNFASRGHVRFGSSECDYLGNGNYGTQIVFRNCNSIPGYTGPITVVPTNPCAAKNQFYAAADQPWPVITAAGGSLNAGDSTPSGANYFPGRCAGAAAISFPQANGNVFVGTGLTKASLEQLDFQGSQRTPQDLNSTAAMYVAGNNASYGADFGGWAVNYYNYGIVQGPASAGMHGVASVGPTGDANTYHNISIHAADPLAFVDLQNSRLDQIDTYSLSYNPYDGTAVGPGTCLYVGYTQDEQTGAVVTSTSYNDISAWECEPDRGGNQELPAYVQLDQGGGTYTTDNFEGAFSQFGGTGQRFVNDTIHVPSINYGTSSHFDNVAGLATYYINNTWANGGFIDWGQLTDCSYIAGGSAGPSVPCAPGETQPFSGRTVDASFFATRFENLQNGMISPGEWNTNQTLDPQPMAAGNVVDTTEPFVGHYAGCNLGGSNQCSVAHFDGFTGFIMVGNNNRLTDTSYNIAADFKSLAGAGQFNLVIAVEDPGTGTCSSGAAILATYTIPTTTSWVAWQTPSTVGPVNFSGHAGCAVTVTMNTGTTTDQYQVGKFDFYPVPNKLPLPTASPTIGNPCLGPDAIVGVNASGPIACYNGTYVQASGGSGGAAGGVLSGTYPNPQGVGMITPALSASQIAGTADSYATIQAAMTTAQTGCLEVYIPAGTYKTSAGLTYSANCVRIRGAGSYVTSITASGTGYNTLTAGNGASNQIGPTGYVSGVHLLGPARTNAGYSALQINGLTAFRVDDVWVDYDDMGFDAINNNYQTQFTNVRGCFAGTCNVGINMRTGSQSGSDISFYNAWVVGQICGVSISNNAGGFHFWGGQIAAGEGTSSATDTSGAFCLGKDYLTSATGEANADIHGTSVEGTNYAWAFRAFAQVHLTVESLGANPANSSAPAIGLYKNTNAQNSTVQLTGVGISGYWSNAALIVDGGGYGNDSYIESGTYSGAQNPTIAGVYTYISCMTGQSSLTNATCLDNNGWMTLNGLSASSNGAGHLQVSTNYGSSWTTVYNVGDILNNAIFSGSAVNSATGVAISGTNFNSIPQYWKSNFWNGTASQAQAFNVTAVAGTGTNPTETLKFQGTAAGFPGTTGAVSYSFDAPVSGQVGTFTQTICSGTVALGTSAISSGAAASTVTATCTGLLSTDNIMLDFNASPLGVVGYEPSTAGTLTIIKWPTTNTINISVVNNTGSSVTPGAITLNYRATR